ncbi:sensor histidine kinase [Kitasatospora purpeofusca]|uniref:sensor histidine kinase n=1 Tax=Kitasatospora purpeofusca TaxID=67352 RepID=UPI002258BB42|nr:histidine kinase [Kitasatospora purpeofusca]MCX4687951.1 histidine kinase [Kitasatospora purpeofusca]
MTTESRISGGGAVRAQTEAALAAGGRGLARLSLLVLGAVPVVVVPVFGAFFAGATTAWLLDSYYPAVFLALIAAVGAALALAGLFVRPTATRTRGQLNRWYGTRLQAVYTPRPPLEADARGHWWTGYSYHRSHNVARLAQLLHWAARDAVVRREMLWLLVSPLLAIALGAVVVVVLGSGVASLVVAVRGNGPVGSRGAAALLLSTLLGLALLALGTLLAPYAVRGYAEVARRVLDKDGRASHAQLTRRVAELTETRADAVGDQAAELRRIERDLHDGAQARLVAIGMTLGTIEHLMETDPVAARELLSEARQSSARALQELRDLVRGIHPPVLAERGLGDAVRALALDCALPTEVCVSLPDRPAAPVEATAYFSICELLANAAKHSGAEQVWVDILYRAGRLRVTVTDDGVGVADPTRGTGLRGIERRLGTFDGVLAIDSTSGGPTTITLELPCELSSPRTFTSFEKV